MKKRGHFQTLLIHYFCVVCARALSGSGRHAERPELPHGEAEAAGALRCRGGRIRSAVLRADVSLGARGGGVEVNTRYV